MIYILRSQRTTTDKGIDLHSGGDRRGRGLKIAGNYGPTRTGGGVFTDATVTDMDMTVIGTNVGVITGIGPPYSIICSKKQ